MTDEEVNIFLSLRMIYKVTIKNRIMLLQLIPVIVNGSEYL